ncbi:alpha/beta hydrolase family protein [Agromyces sp. GXS1127]|uniref:alpha/beta hydrolase family protein n=1 Tax=Agromyces sp. GXS1127 TaxID=3424181 RepID=UPI003D31DBFB
MSDLTVRSGGRYSVETDALIAEAVRLSAAAHVIDGWTTRAAMLRAEAEQLGHADAGWSAAIDLDTAHTGFAAANAAATDLSSSLGLSAARYAVTEDLVAGLADASRRVAAGLMGLVLPGLALPMLSAGAISVGVIASANVIPLLIDHERHLDDVGAALDEFGRSILSDPAFVGLVRAAADQADEFLAGLFRIPGLFAVGAGLDAPENAGLLLAAAGAVGLVTGSRTLRETAIGDPVRVDPPPGRGARGAEPGAPPAGIGADGAPIPAGGIQDLAERIPPSDAGGPQVRIERYETDDGPRWIVYSAGTADFGLTPDEEPYDMTANLHGVAAASALHDLVGLPTEAAASERAVRAAMREAGIADGDPVMVVGHSAGGMVAANLAADPDLGVVAAVNFGGPAAQVATGATPLLSVGHDEDFVHATAGSGVPATGRIEVGLSAGPLDPDADGIVPAHAMDRYVASARQVDASADRRLVEFRGLVTGFTTGATSAEVTYWRAERKAG